MSKPKPQLPDLLVRALDESGVPWRAELGKKHVKLFVGERMVQTVPLSYRSGEFRRERNMMAAVRRAVQQYREQRQ